MGSGTEVQRLRQLESLMQVASSMAVVGAPWLEKLKVVYDFFRYVLEDKESALYSKLVWPFAAYSDTLNKVLQSSHAADHTRQEDWDKHVPEALQPDLERAQAGDGETCNKLGVLFALGNLVLTRSLPFDR